MKTNLNTKRTISPEHIGTQRLASDIFELNLTPAEVRKIFGVTYSEFSQYVEGIKKAPEEVFDRMLTYWCKAIVVSTWRVNHG